MPTPRRTELAVEHRRDPRYPSPALEVVIGDERFRAINWSMRGALVYGIYDAVGVRVRGEFGVPGSRETVPFAATIVRNDVRSGNTAICFEDCRTEKIEFPAQVTAALQ